MIEDAAVADDDFTAVPELFNFSDAEFVLFLSESPVSFNFVEAASFFVAAAAEAASCVAFNFIPAASFLAAAVAEADSLEVCSARDDFATSDLHREVAVG